MTLHQGLAFGLIGVTLLLFIWGRWRYDLIALCSVLTGVLIGVVPAAGPSGSRLCPDARLVHRGCSRWRTGRRVIKMA